MTSQLKRPAVLPVWAEAGDKVQPSSPELQTGWPFSNIPPSRQRFNWILNFLANGVSYLARRGISDWSAEETYLVGDRVAFAGKTWVSTIDGNLGTEPAEGTKWKLWALDEETVRTIIPEYIEAHNQNLLSHPDIRALIEALFTEPVDPGDTENPTPPSPILGTSLPYPDTVMRRDNSGRAQVENPVQNLEIANKQYVDNRLTGRALRFFFATA